MLLSAEDRLAYWGYRHLNISCRDINDEEEPDLVGLERILYSVGFLAVTNLQGISAFDEEPVADEEEEAEVEYEPADSSLNPFDYEPADEDESITAVYPQLDDDFGMLIACADEEAAASGDWDFAEEEADENDSCEQPTYLVLEAALLKKAA